MLADGAGTTTKMVPTDDRGHIPAIHADFLEDFSTEAKSLLPHRSIDYAVDLEPGYNLRFGWIYNFSELSRVVFTQLRGLRSGAHEAGSWIWT